MAKRSATSASQDATRTGARAGGVPSKRSSQRAPSHVPATAAHAIASTLAANRSERAKPNDRSGCACQNQPTVSGKSENSPPNARVEIGRLAEAFNAMAAQLQAHDHEIRSLATVAERERLAREMHDGLAQALALVRMRLHSLDESVARGDVLSARAMVGELRDVVGRASQEVRQSIFDLSVMVSRDLGLVPTLTEYLHDFSVESGIRVDFATHGGEFEFAPGAELQLMRILQEALTNVRRHARAASVSVRLERAGDAARLVVTDDGCGFDPTQPAADARPRFGLATMQERADAAGGKFRLESRPGRGTTVEATLPLHIAEE